MEKSALLKIANDRNYDRGCGYRDCRGCTASRFVADIGGWLGGAGVNELFHFESTDAIAHRMARSAAFRQPRAAPAYLPDSNQIRNCERCFKRNRSGAHRRFGALGSRRDGGFGGASQQSGFSEGEITANITIEFPDGTVQEIRDQMLRLSAQDR